MTPKEQTTKCARRAKSAPIQPAPAKPASGTRRKGQTPAPKVQQDKSESDNKSQLSPAKKAAVSIIKANWSIENIAEMFTHDEHKKTLMQMPKANDSFFEESTLALIQRLSELTKGKQEDVQADLRKRWIMRCKGNSRDKGIKRRAGSDNMKKNRNLRNDMRTFIKKANLREVLDPEWSNESGDDEAITTDMIATIKRCWELDALSEIMPEHSFPSGLADKPESWPQELLKHLRDLALITNRQPEEVEHELNKIFEREDEYDSARALEIVTGIYQRFDKERRTTMIETISVNWQEGTIPSHLPDRAYSGPPGDILDWPFELLQAVFDLSEVSAGQDEDVTKRLEQAFQSTSKYNLRRSLKNIKVVHASFVGGEVDSDTNDDEEEPDTGTSQSLGQAQGADGTIDEDDEVEIVDDDQQDKPARPNTGLNVSPIVSISKLQADLATQPSGKRKTNPTPATSNSPQKTPRTMTQTWLENDKEGYLTLGHEVTNPHLAQPKGERVISNPPTNLTIAQVYELELLELRLLSADAAFHVAEDRLEEPRDSNGTAWVLGGKSWSASQS